MTIRYTDAIAIECDQPGCHETFARPGMSVFDVPFEAARFGWTTVRDARHHHYCPMHSHGPIAA
mgnify:CR=1 FL=1